MRYELAVTMATQKHFAVLFSLLSCCVNSLMSHLEPALALTKITSTPGFLQEKMRKKITATQNLYHSVDDLLRVRARESLLPL